MKRLYWILRAMFDPIESDKLTDCGCWECYLQMKGIESEHTHMVDGYKLGKKLE